MNFENIDVPIVMQPWLENQMFPEEFQSGLKLIYAWLHIREAAAISTSVNSMTNAQRQYLTEGQLASDMSHSDLLQRLSRGGKVYSVEQYEFIQEKLGRVNLFGREAEIEELLNE